MIRVGTIASGIFARQAQCVESVISLAGAVRFLRVSCAWQAQEFGRFVTSISFNDVICALRLSAVARAQYMCHVISRPGRPRAYCRSKSDFKTRLLKRFYLQDASHNGVSQKIPTEKHHKSFSPARVSSKRVLECLTQKVFNQGVVGECPTYSTVPKGEKVIFSKLSRQSDL